MGQDPDARILESWGRNAGPWARVVRAGSIASRSQVTDAAIVGAIVEGSPQTVLDLGCGEGWLTRRLTDTGADVLGVDGTAALIDEAAALGVGRFAVHTFEEVPGALAGQRFDVVACNFSLLGEDSVEALIHAIPHLLTRRGRLIIQTSHPEVARGGGPYQSGWRQGSWEGFGEAFSDPAPWYYRTVEDWVSLLQRAGFVVQTRSGVLPETGQRVSLLLIARVAPSSPEPPTEA